MAELSDEQVKAAIGETVKSLTDDDLTDLLFNLRAELHNANRLAGEVLRSFENLQFGVVAPQPKTHDPLAEQARLSRADMEAIRDAGRYDTSLLTPIVTPFGTAVQLDDRSWRVLGPRHKVWDGGWA